MLWLSQQCGAHYLDSHFPTIASPLLTHSVRFHFGSIDAFCRQITCRQYSWVCSWVYTHSTVQMQPAKGRIALVLSRGPATQTYPPPASQAAQDASPADSVGLGHKQWLVKHSLLPAWPGLLVKQVLHAPENAQVHFHHKLVESIKATSGNNIDVGLCLLTLPWLCSKTWHGPVPDWHGTVSIAHSHAS